jgi:protein SCO1/2
MPRFAVILFVVIGLVFAASLGLLLAMAAGRSRAVGMPSAGTSSRRSIDPLTPDDNTRGMAIPPFTLKDQDGRAITNDLFTGKVTIVDFYFTHCKLICPLLVQHMRDQVRSLKGTPVKFLSISVDPEHDTPEVIKAYATEHGADPARWTFATGDRQTIGEIVQRGLKYAVGDDPNPDRAIKLEDGRTMNNIVHPSWFVLVGPKGNVLGFYLAEAPTDMRELAERARAASEQLGR